MVGPTGLLRPLRIPDSQRSLLECFVKPAGSQVQTFVGHAPIKKRQQVDDFSWSGRQDCFALYAFSSRNIRC
jgi:hypothetical protein